MRWESQSCPLENSFLHQWIKWRGKLTMTWVTGYTPPRNILFFHSHFITLVNIQNGLRSLVCFYKSIISSLCSIAIIDIPLKIRSRLMGAGLRYFYSQMVTLERVSGGTSCTSMEGTESFLSNYLKCITNKFPKFRSKKFSDLFQSES